MMGQTLENRVQMIEDIFAIQKLKRTYIDYANGGWDRPTHDYERIAELWVEDGVFDARPLAGIGAGRAGLREFFKNSQKEASFAIHYMTNPVIEIDGDTASGHWQVLVTFTFQKDNAFLWLGMNDDEYQRTPDGWKFKSVKCTAAAFTPYQIGWGKMPFPIAGPDTTEATR